MLIIGITGQKRSGKDTLATAMHQWFTGTGVKSSIDSFAAPIRKFFYEHFDMTDENKEVPIEELDGLTPRKGMITMGTEWGRDMLHPNLWVYLLFKRIQKLGAAGEQVVIIPDVRFEDEAKQIKKAGGVLVGIIRTSTRDLDPPHRSEQGIPSYLLDMLVINDISAKDLVAVGQDIACRAADKYLKE